MVFHRPITILKWNEESEQMCQKVEAKYSDELEESIKSYATSQISK